MAPPRSAQEDGLTDAVLRRWEMTAQVPGLRFRAPRDPDLRGRLYRGLAQELALSTAPAAVVFESSTQEERPELTVHPTTLVATIAAAPAFRGPTLEPVALEPDTPDGLRPSVTWTLSPVDASCPASTPHPIWDVPEARSLLGPEGRLLVQTFWAAGRSDGRVWVGRRARLEVTSEHELGRRVPGVARFVTLEWTRALGILGRARPTSVRASDWRVGSPRALRRADWIAVGPLWAVRSAEPTLPQGHPTLLPDGAHTTVLGASGAGKTTYLADRAASAIAAGQAVFAIDLHGDLAPAVVARLPPSSRERLVAVDVGHRPVVGVAALGGHDDRTAAHFVAAVRRLTPDGSDLYWGFRLERLFDAFVRLVQESGGSLIDLYALLTDTDRREAARLGTRSPELGRFLDELGPIVRRNPDFLWAAAARLSKIVLVPQLSELLAPNDGGLPVEDLLEGGRSVLVRVPFSDVGPEAAGFAGSLLLARTYLGLLARRAPGSLSLPVLMVLDEVQGFSPRLVAEMLAEGRKFGLRLLLATQYPERLSPELRSAAAGVSQGVVAFRIPRASAADVGGWLGLSAVEAERTLPELPVGIGLVRGPASTELRSVVAGVPATDPSRAWAESAERTRAEHPPPSTDAGSVEEEVAERLLLTVLAADEQGRPLEAGQWVEVAHRDAGGLLDRATLEDRARTLERSGQARLTDGRWHLTPGGERRLGLTTVTGASRESEEHRALLLRAFRLFARKGYRIEIVRQGRYDTTLPDARLRQLPERTRSMTPAEVGRTVDLARVGWAWRFFRGRDVHIEAEVSGALRPARVRHGLAKARARGAFPLFLVGDARRAARIRRTFREERLGPDQAQVWTLVRDRSS